MSTALTTHLPDEDVLFSAIAEGNLMKLSPTQKLAYYNRRCSDLGLNPLNQPFQWIVLNGKLTLYANRQCTEELRKVHSVSIYKVDKEKLDDLYVVTAYARDKTGREDSSTGAVTLSGLKGEAMANAMMKAETKAKRRVTLSICGLGLLDETEVATIPGALPPEGKTEAEAVRDYEKQHMGVIAKAEGYTAIEGTVEKVKESKGLYWFDLNGLSVCGNPEQFPEVASISMGDEVQFYGVKATAGKKEYYVLRELGVVLKPSAPKIEATNEDVPF